MKKVGIIGGTGYTGGELARILCVHPDIEIKAMTSRQNAGKKVSDVQTYLKGYLDIEYTENISNAKDLDLVFVATPHGVAMKETPALVASGTKVIDMSGDYRLLDPAQYKKWYGHDHTDTENLKDSVYGLPEFFRPQIKKANVVANPGCYPTATILAVAPLLISKAVSTDIIVDAKSGTSGAGMVPSPRTHHPFCGETIIPYSVGTHRHTPEMEFVLGTVSKSETKILFTPHLLPVIRGILSTCYLTLIKDMTNDEIAKIYEKQYKNEPFVQFTDEPSIRAVVCSNHAQVNAKVFGNKVVAFGAIDNLVKGASGQAVQCANLMLGLKETAGLMTPGMGV
ncbi:MAG: N-acetyl-gamma-glutamyl-phosphate reductase [Methanomassiliicoccaceae archaeon]|jgi:N-acetyl-gamma-glutamyl-phosphate reductase|nr:N-acetyl-gamma-glutamyl-phosphate reductase [Methanomassiliicoccaceae archaeon]